MSPTRFRLDQRTVDDLRAELRIAAARRPGPAGQSWASLLFDADGSWRDAAEPSQALLDVTLHAHLDLADHLAELPARALHHYLADLLAIAPLAPIADRVAVTFTGDPKALPVVVPAGTELRAGRTPDGRPRPYATEDAVTIVGARIGAVRSHHGDGAPSRDRTGAWDRRDTPFAPFDSGHPFARHELVLVTDALDCDGGSLDVRVGFAAGTDVSRLEGVRWRHTTPNGVRDVVAARLEATGIVLTLGEGQGPCELDGERISALIADLPSARLESRWLEALVDGPTVAITARGDVAPSAALFNDGSLDLAKEFAPFGPTPKRGDSFYLRCDEAFGKPLASLRIELNAVVDAGPVVAVSAIGDYIDGVLGLAATNNVNPFSGKEYDTFLAASMIWKPYSPEISWQRRRGQDWEAFVGRDRLETVDLNYLNVGGAAMSDPVMLGGETGRYVRAFLSGGDFGWAAYQRRLASVVGSTTPPKSGELIPPEPPRLGGVTLSYSTVPVRVTDVRVRNGLDAAAVTGPIRPFDDPTATGPLGRLDVHLLTPGEIAGSTVSLYVEVAGAAACPRPLAVSSPSWSVPVDAGQWRALSLIDGTRGLRQSGVVRFVAPPEWTVETDGSRRLRMETNAPSAAGTLLAIVPDATIAGYRFGIDRASDAAPATPLPAGAITALAGPLAGVKKVTNPGPSSGGRGPEVGYVERATGVLRHRNRAVAKWDYEQLVLSGFPEVAVASCLPRFRADGSHAAGSVGIVVVPRSAERAPAPSVDLAERIVNELAAHASPHASIDVVCADYQLVGVGARIVLRRGVAALTARAAIVAVLDAWLHPLRLGADGIGRSLFRSAVVALLEAQPDIDVVDDVAFVGRAGDDVITVDPCRGLIASSGDHSLELEEQL